jgi:hypothetical protein
MCVLYFALVTSSQYITEVVRVAQLVEALHYKLEVVGSIPDGFIRIFLLT